MKGALAVAALVAASTSAHAEDAFTRAQTLHKEAIAAYKSGKLAEAASDFEKASALRPDQPSYKLSLATLDAKLGRKAEAIRFLNDYAALGLRADVQSDPDFASLENDPAFMAVVRRLAGNGKPVGAPEAVVTVSDGEALYEGIAFDKPTSRWFLGSVRDRKIVVVSADGKASDFVPAGRDGVPGVFGLAMDAKHNRLYAAVSAVEQTQNLKTGELGSAGIFAFDPKTGALVDKAIVSDGKKRVFGDLAVAPDGSVYLTDSLNPQIFRYTPSTHELKEFVSSGKFHSLQGPVISTDGKRLIASDYSVGIQVIDLGNKSVTTLQTPHNTTLLGIDGFVNAGSDSFIAVQNGTDPQRILRLTLDSGWHKIKSVQVLMANVEGKDEPSLGTVAGDYFYYFATSQWDRFNDGGSVKKDAKFEPALIARLKIR